MPSVTLATTALASVATVVFQGAGMADYPLIVVEHPVAGLVENVVRTRITAPIMEEIINGLTVQPKQEARASAGQAEIAPAERLVYEADSLAEATRKMNDDFMAKDWGDGLPLVPPTPELVKTMLAATKRAPSDVLGLAGPGKGMVTVESIAINAAMAGCRPEYMPVLIAMMEAALRPEFDLYRQCVTTQPVAPMVIVSGPATDVSQLNINSGVGVYGPGWQANATIGRTLRLIMLNVGGAIPGDVNKSTLGQFARYTAAWAVNRAENPFPSLQEQISGNTRINSQIAKYYELEQLPAPKAQSIGPDEDVVIMMAIGDRNNVNDNNSKDGEGILNSVATAMLTAELVRPDASHGVISGIVLVSFGPQHAKILAEDGWTIERMREYLFKEARYPLKRWVPAHSDTVDSQRENWRQRDAAEVFAHDGTVAMVEHPDQIYFTVAGGPGSHSAVFNGVYAPLTMAKVGE